MVCSREHLDARSGGPKWGEEELGLPAAVSELNLRLGRAPNATELARRLSVSREEVFDYLFSQPCFRGDRRAGCLENQENVSLYDLENKFIESCGAEGLYAALKALSDEERAVVAMRMGGALSHTEIASRIGTPPPRVSTLLAQALTKLRVQLQ